jgi:hypothetical protein
MAIPPVIKILSVILGIVACSLCRAASGPQPQLVGQELVLSVDPTTNTASGLIYLSNPTEKEISLSLSADDFKSQTSGLGLNTKVVFAAPLQTTGEPVYEAKLAAGTTATVKVEVSNFLEAGEATAHLCNFGEPIGTLRATKWRPAFAVKIMSPTPDKPEFSFTKSRPRQITLKNDDAMTYQVAVAAEVDGIWSAASRVTLTPNGSTSLELNPREEWFPKSAAIKERISDGSIRIQWPASEAGSQPALVERIIPFKAHLNSLGEFWQATWGYLFVLGFVILGGVASMLLSNWVPNRLSRADIEEQLNDLARKTTGLSSRIDSGLRVYLRVERNRLHRLLRSRWIFSANFPDVVKQCSDKIAVLSKQIDLAGQLDRAREALEPLLQCEPIPINIDLVDRDLQKAADQLRRCDCTAEHLEAAKTLITGAANRIGKMDQPDPDLVEKLTARIETLKTYVNPAPPTEPTDALKELKKLFPKLFSSFDPNAAANLQPSQYSSVDLVTAQLELVRKYQDYYDAGRQPKFPRQDEGVKCFHTNTISGLRRARLLLREIKEGKFVEDIEGAIEHDRVEIIVEPAPVEDQLARFTIRFRSDDLNAAAARDELRCEWDFGHDQLRETGWEAYHYFPPPRRGWRERLWRWVRPWRKPESRTFEVRATFSKRIPDPDDPNPKVISISRKVEVREAPKNTSADRNLAEGVRLGIALVIALIGLLAGAREQLTKLDVIPAAIAVFLLGFGADTIKNLISPKQAQK